MCACLCSYDIMLECWQEHPIDRPTFSKLRKKFGDLLMASTTDSYMLFQVDEDKTYYTMGEDEDEKKKFKGSQTSLSSTESGSAKKQPKKIEKPKWAQDANAYVDTPSTFKEGHTHSVDEHYRHNTVGAADLERKKKSGNGIKRSGASSSEIGEGKEVELPSHAPLSLSNSLPAASATNARFEGIDNPVGIPLSFVSANKQQSGPTDNSQCASSSSGGKGKKAKSNPYVDDPKSMHLLADGVGVDASGNQGNNNTPGSERVAHVPQGIKLMPMTAELNSHLVNRQMSEVEESSVTVL